MSGQIIGPIGVLPASGAVSFPTLTNLVGHWRADVGVTLSGSNVVSVAAQDGGAGLALTNNNTVPFAATGSSHGQPAFNFLAANGAALSTTSAMTFSGGDLSVFAVGQMLAATQSYGRIGGMLNNTADGNDSAGFEIGRDNLTNNLISFQNGTAASGDAAVSLATQYRVLMIYTGGLTTIYLNNISAATGTNSFAGGSNTFVALGQGTAGGVLTTNTSWEGPISDYAIWNHALTSGERDSLDAYATSNWGS